MKIIRYWIAAFLIIFLLAGCSKQQSPETEMMPYEIATVIMESQSELPSLDQMTPKDENFILWLSDYYLISTGQVADGVICYADGVEASEIAVLVLADEKNSKVVCEALNEYMQNRAGVFEGYAPQQAALVKDGIVVANGRYVALLICQDTSAAETAFLSCFEKKESSGNHPEEALSSTPVSEPEENSKSQAVNDTYDSQAVLQAWKSGDDSALSEMNCCILNAAKDVIEQEIDDDMSEYEKELAIHDWITGWSSFDMSAFSHTPGSGSGSDSDNPYGVLIGHTGNCWGYSSTFQLFMDMLDIECITVYGTPSSSGVEHAWNMVQLDGEWYCVDVAWDDPIGGNPGHTYFNVTSATLRKGSIHHWDEASVPEAAGTDYAYDNQ